MSVVDYYEFMVICVSAAFVTGLLPILYMRNKAWIWVGPLVPIAVCAFGAAIAKWTTLVSHPISGVNTISDADMLSGMPQAMYIVAFLLSVLSAVVTGSVLRKVRGFSFLESIGYTMGVGAITMMLIGAQAV
jgi:hypothetical protein